MLNLRIRHYSLRQRMSMLGGYLALVISLFLSLLFFEHSSYLEDHKTSLGISEAEVQLLNLRRYEKDFMARMKPELLSKFQVQSERMSDKLDQWFSDLSQTGFRHPDMELLRKAMLAYRLNFLEYVEYRKQLGIFKNEGLQEDLNQLSSALLNSLPEKNSDSRALLTRLQSLHQVFLFDPEDDVVHEFERQATVLQSKLSTVQAEKLRLYRDAFQEAVRISSLMGYNENDGAHYLLRRAAHDMEARFSVLSDAVATHVEQRYQKRVFLIICSSVLLVALSALVLWRIAFSIATPLRQLKQDVELLRQGRRDLVFEFESDEIGKVFSSLRSFQSDLAQLDQMRAAEKQHQQVLLKEKQKLEHALAALKEAQGQLIQSEKLASLGSLVAGVAHEINTPLGIALTMGTTFSDHLKVFFHQMQTGQLRRSYVEEFQHDAEEGLQVMQTALHRAAHLIQSFKQVAVDQASEERRFFNLLQTVQGILQTMHHMVKRRDLEIQVMIPEDIFLDSYPGPFGQVISNFINNALLHAFAEEQHGVITISAVQEDEKVFVSFSDNGAGIAEKNLSRIFEPFFTTKLGQGGSGLGLNIVYNIVTGILEGEISVKSVPGEGTCFYLMLPLKVHTKEIADE